MPSDVSPQLAEQLVRSVGQAPRPSDETVAVIAAALKGANIPAQRSK